MKAHELLTEGVHEQPLFVTILQQLLTKKQKVVRYVRRGDRFARETYKSCRMRKSTLPGAGDTPKVVCTLQDGWKPISIIAYDHQTVDDDYEIVKHERFKDTWVVKRRSKQ